MNALRFALKQAVRNVWGFGLVVLFATLAGLSFLLGEQLQTQTEKQLIKNISGVDIVVGAKGSPLQLILSTLFFMDNPTGNIPAGVAKQYARNPMVESVLPLALGNSYQGHRLVGSDTAFLSFYHAEIASGTVYQAPFELVIGAQVASQRGLNLGDEVVTQHGMSQAAAEHHHDAHPYLVKGILEPCNCPADNVLFTAVQSITDAHSHGHNHDSEQEITALLLRCKNALSKLQLPRTINENTTLQAAIPSIEVDRLLGLTSGAFQALGFFSGLFYLVCVLAMVAAFMSRFKERQRDAVLLRLEGYSSGQVQRLILTEALLMIAVAVLCIAVFYPCLSWILENGVLAGYGLQLALWPEILSLFACVGGLLVAALISWFILWLRFRKMSIQEVLAREAY